MKLSQTIAITLAFAAAAGIVGYMVRWSKTKRMLNLIADEGYETAEDILFPGKKVQSKNLHYGPVISGYNVIQ
jgi:hypothetical protein